MGRVLLVFRDGSLGGTSRSALTAGDTWRAAGFEVDFLPLVQPHLDRAVRMGSIGSVLSLRDVEWPAYSLVHLHHGIVKHTEDSRRVKEVFDAHRLSGARVPLLTNNIFAEPEPVVRSWDGAVTVGVLGPWAARQYRLRNWPRPSKLAVIPNPQDLAFFRPPTEAERARAREALGVAQFSHVLLRVGSPLEGKWHSAYEELAHALPPSACLVVVGAPPSLKSHLAMYENVRVIDPMSIDEDIRNAYWSADVFVHAARQGESFGNVLIEARACGLAVEYLSRPRGDNTPWDFEFLGRFVISVSAREWISSCKEHAMRTQSPTNESTMEATSERDNLRVFGIESVAGILRALAQGAVATGSRTWRSQPIGWANWIALAVSSNPVTLAAKRMRRKRRA